MSYIDVSNEIEADLIDKEETADRFKQAKQAEVAEQKAAMTDITLKGTKEQLDNVARFCITNGVKVIKASERETAIE